jgi:patatin-like phospholipase/acyl hydrolase
MEQKMANLITNSSEGNSRKLCLLSLDGGGVRGLSSLLILQKLMKSLDDRNPPLPCDYFDMIAGTSIGGLIAIILGRLHMSVDECILEYKKLSPKIFAKIHHHRVNFKGEVQGRFDHKALEGGIRTLLKNRGLDPVELFAEENARCKT